MRFKQGAELAAPISSTKGSQGTIGFSFSSFIMQSEIMISGLKISGHMIIYPEHANYDCSFRLYCR